MRANWFIGGIAAGLVATLGPAAMAYFSTHPIRRRVPPVPGGFPGAEEVTFPSRDGLLLAGWFLPAPAARAGIILCHGFPNNRGEMLPWARLLHPLGAHLLLFDFRGLGRSQGRLCSLGWHESRDVVGAVDHMAARPELSGLPIGVFGLSMGGAAAILAASRDARIRAVATHGAYARLNRAIEQRGRLFLGPLGRAAAPPTLRWLRHWLPEDPCCIAPADTISRISPRPVLVCHGVRDRIVNAADARMLFDGAGEPKELMLLPRSWHAHIHPADLAGYRRALLRFFDQRLLR